jgi:hypothetical protein
VKKNEIDHIYQQNEHEHDLKVQTNTNYGISNLLKNLITYLIYEKSYLFLKRFQSN